MKGAEGTQASKGTNGTQYIKCGKSVKGTDHTTGFTGPGGDPLEGRRGDAAELVPNLEQAKFIALGAQLVIIRDLCHQDLRFKVSEAS